MNILIVSIIRTEFTRTAHFVSLAIFACAKKILHVFLTQFLFVFRGLRECYVFILSFQLKFAREEYHGNETR